MENFKLPDLAKYNSDKEFTEIFIDGASRGNPGSSSIGIVIKDSSGNSHKLKKYLGILTNNQAEYQALIAALKYAKKLKKTNLKIHTDSLLLANQINNIWKVRHPDIKILHKEAVKLISNFNKVDMYHIPRFLNEEADMLANEALDDYHS
ncbi:MAG: ribonuclease HI family protein [Thermodesulfobacteriota bacterium]